MKYIIYQTTNLINNKIYIGQHKTKDPNIFDGYLGCGIKVNMPSSYMNPCSPLQYAVKKYGVKNFKRTILKVVDTLEEALKIEAELVDYDFLKRHDTYNAQLGGITGYKYLPFKYRISCFPQKEIYGSSPPVLINFLFPVISEPSSTKYSFTK